jgi:uncharacterized membrane protein SpoIIM required for sporulation
MATPVSDNDLKSASFRREREATWKRLADLLARIERNGIASATSQELMELPVLYRATVSSLSVARAISLDRNLLTYLESLAARAYFCVYGSRSRFGEVFKHFIAVQLPAAVRAARWHIAVAAGVTVLGVAVGWLLVGLDSDWFYALVDAWSASSRNPESTTSSLRETLYDQDARLTDMLIAFVSFLFTHNAKIGIMCFALGFALGLPVIYLLFVNGLALGAFYALFASHGLAADFAGWIAIHGTTELAAIILCGAAGLVMGEAVAFPGRLKRSAALKVSGRQATVIALGAVGMLFVAALLEGLGRQLIQDTGLRFAIGGIALAFWIAYFGFAGRRGL